ncbi:hypothetical protein VTL71DRAFT_14779 [Oculimacula yallundae]|uniref:Uncharacterized protein n=1 Tax=Oculimacula yallundae TaxID=86028 RepID=A0ABR4CLQ6_9HELO
MPPPSKGSISTALQPMRLPPLHKLRVRRPNQADANPCLTLMSSVLTRRDGQGDKRTPQLDEVFADKTRKRGSQEMDNQKLNQKEKEHTLTHLLQQHVGLPPVTPQQAARPSRRNYELVWTRLYVYISFSYLTTPESRAKIRAKSRKTLAGDNAMQRKGWTDSHWIEALDQASNDS